MHFTISMWKKEPFFAITAWLAFLAVLCSIFAITAWLAFFAVQDVLFFSLQTHSAIRVLESELCFWKVYSDYIIINASVKFIVWYWHKICCGNTEREGAPVPFQEKNLKIRWSFSPQRIPLRIRYQVQQLSMI